MNWEEHFNREKFLSMRYIITKVNTDVIPKSLRTMPTNSKKCSSAINLVTSIKLRCIPTLEIITIYVYDFEGCPFALQRELSFGEPNAFKSDMVSFVDLRLSTRLCSSIKGQDYISLFELVEVAPNFCIEDVDTRIERFCRSSKYMIDTVGVCLSYTYNKDSHGVNLIVRFKNSNNSCDTIVISTSYTAVTVNGITDTSYLVIGAWTVTDFHFSKEDKCYCIELDKSFEILVYLDGSLECNSYGLDNTTNIKSKLIPFAKAFMR